MKISEKYSRKIALRELGVPDKVQSSYGREKMQTKMIKKQIVGHFNAIYRIMREFLAVWIF